MGKKLIKSAKKTELGTDRQSSEFGSDLKEESRNPFSKKWARLLSALDAPTDAILASKLGITQPSVAGAKRKERIPPGWITDIALNRGVSADWLLTGEGEMSRGGTEKARQVPPRQAGPIYNDAEPGEESHATAPPKNIGDLVSKTIEVLQSQTVFETALTSNIEAFHHAISLEKKIDNVEDRIMNKISKRLDDLESDNKKLRRENKQLRDEIQRDRDQSVAEDTG
jgi:hypothetical protein